MKNDTRNCSTIRRLLPAHIYGDLDPPQKQAIDDHLSTCPQCRAEHAALADVRRLLDVAPVSQVDVNVGRILAEANRRERLRTRRWRRIAWLVSGAAAALLVAFLVRFEARWEGRQLVLRFGLPARDEAQPLVVADKQRPPAPEVTAADLQLVKDLVHSLAAAVDERDGKFQETLAQLEWQLNQAQAQASTRWAATERYVSALYTSQLDSHVKGD